MCALGGNSTQVALRFLSFYRTVVGGLNSGMEFSLDESARLVRERLCSRHTGRSRVRWRLDWTYTEWPEGLLIG
uniref:Uncharacterized protein n=1 Tax=mine drainage metagenome TaxID=410659 RepID=E6PXA3_9ZZZZ